MEKNEEYIVTVTGVSGEGFGVGHLDGMTVFVPLTVPGDVARVHLVKVKKSYCFGKMTELLTASEHRIVPDCPVFSRCGGCAYRHISYDAEKEIKTAKVRDAFAHIGKIAIEPQPILTAKSPDRYRNKAQYPFASDGSVGFYAIHSHRVVPTDRCFLQPEEFERMAAAVTCFVREKHISVCDENNKHGLLRHLYLRKATATGELMAVLVINGKNFPYAAGLISALRSAAGENLKTVVLNHNADDTNVILGKNNTVLFGDGTITDILCGMRVRLSPLSFYQVNREMAEVLYDRAAEYAVPDGQTVLDLYCGAGTIGLSMAARAKKIIGVEIIPQAVVDARFNASAAGITNAEFICGDAAECAALLASRGEKPDVVVVDPPRKGCDSALLSTISRDFSPKRLVYVSCDPATLARDCAILSEDGYRLMEVTPVDLFPRTAHVETVALLMKN